MRSPLNLQRLTINNAIKRQVIHNNQVICCSQLRNILFRFIQKFLNSSLAFASFIGQQKRKIYQHVVSKDKPETPKKLSAAAKNATKKSRLLQKRKKSASVENKHQFQKLQQ